MSDTSRELDGINHMDFRAKFERIRSLEAGGGYRIPAQHVHVRLQKLDHRRIGLAILCDEKPVAPTSLQLLSCEVRKLEAGWVLNVVEREPSDERLVPFFVDLCRKIYFSPNSVKAVATVKSVVSEWNRAFSKDQDLLSPEAMLGLVGELRILSMMLNTRAAADHHEVLSWWQGPDSADHDFDVPGCFQIEVKATGPATERLRISNEHQLESHDKPLYLACVRVERIREVGHQARTLPEIVGYVAESIPDKTAVPILRDKVRLAGLNVLDSRYEDYAFKVYSVEFYAIKDHTPRIVPTDLKPGVSHVSYQLSTADLEPNLVPQSDVIREA